MYDNMSAVNLLGLKDIMSAGRMPRLNRMDADMGAGDDFAGRLKERLSSLLGDAGTDYKAPAMLTGEDLKLRQLFKASRFGAVDTSVLTDGSDTEAPTESASSQLTPDIVPTSEEGTDSTSPAVPTRSSQDVVMAAGRENALLLEQINNALTKEERLSLETDLRDNIIGALRDEGYNVETTGSLDKISINGNVVDVIQNYGTPGRIARVQYLEAGHSSAVGPNVSGIDNSVVAAILDAAQSGVDLLLQIRNSSDTSEQNQLALQIQQKIADNLTTGGFDASVMPGSPDKISVDGIIYDFIRGLGSAGDLTQFQAILA